MTEYKEIREILERWYAGQTSASEQHRLVEFFSAAEQLPPDMETERAMFLALAEAASAESEIPAGLARRIDDAVEAEIARERSARSGGMKWRRRLLAACGAAACLMCGWLTLRVVTESDNSGVSPDAFMAVNVPASPAAAPEATDTAEDKNEAPSEPVSVAARQQSGRIASAGTRRKLKAVRTEIDRPMEETGDTEEYGFLSEAEEARLMADNYHVVEDEREAYAILSSVFARLEGGMVEESYRIGDISDQYEMEMTKLYD